MGEMRVNDGPINYFNFVKLVSSARTECPWTVLNVTFQFF